LIARLQYRRRRQGCIVEYMLRIRVFDQNSVRAFFSEPLKVRPTRATGL
jgi:hypothetical protein